MLHFAYDGTINGDWVSHYAVRMAARLPERRLRVLCVDEGRLPPSELLRRIELVAASCGDAGVALEREILPGGRGVFAALDAAAPAGRGAHLLLGTRVRERGRGYLSGSVGERMLRGCRRDVLVLRVVNPGLLGRPRRFLVPVGGHRRGFAAGVRALALLAPRDPVVHLLNVRRVGWAALRRLTPRRAERLRGEGVEYCRRVERELEAAVPLRGRVADAHVVVSDDPPKEILALAARLRSGLVLLGASERGLPHRLLHGNAVERVLRGAPCDVAVCCGPP